MHTPSSTEELQTKFYERKYDEVLRISQGSLGGGNDAYIHSLRARCYDIQGDFDNALIEFKKSVKPDQKNCNYNRMLGEFYIRMAKRVSENEKTKYIETLDNALKHLKAAEQIQLKYDTKFYPNRTWNAIADAYALKGDTIKGHEYYDKGIEKNKDDWYGYNGKGVLYQSQGEFEEALKCFEKAKECFLVKVEVEKKEKDEKIAEIEETLAKLEEKIQKCLEALTREPAKLINTIV